MMGGRPVNSVLLDTRPLLCILVAARPLLTCRQWTGRYVLHQCNKYVKQDKTTELRMSWNKAKRDSILLHSVLSSLPHVSVPSTLSLPSGSAPPCFVYVCSLHIFLSSLFSPHFVLVCSSYFNLCLFSPLFVLCLFSPHLSF